jgi:hypothetical protein
MSVDARAKNPEAQKKHWAAKQEAAAQHRLTGN